MTLTNSTALDQSAASVVAKAVFNAAHRLGLSQRDLSEVLGLSQGQISKLKTGDATLTGKAFDIAVYLIRIFRSLDTITGGDEQTNKAWMRNENTDLGMIPSQAIKSVAGLVDTMNYLDSARAPL